KVEAVARRARHHQQLGERGPGDGLREGVERVAALAGTALERAEERHGGLIPAQPAERGRGRAEDLRVALVVFAADLGLEHPDERIEDRKSTRLNSSHVKISYAVF